MRGSVVAEMGGQSHVDPTSADVLLANQLYYSVEAAGYDKKNHVSNPAMLRYYDRLLTEHVFMGAPATELARWTACDVGCGTDCLETLLAGRLGSILAFDATHMMLAGARTRFPGRRIAWIQADAQALPARNRSSIGLLERDAAPRVRLRGGRHTHDRNVETGRAAVPRLRAPRGCRTSTFTSCPNSTSFTAGPPEASTRFGCATSPHAAALPTAASTSARWSVRSAARFQSPSGRMAAGLVLQPIRSPQPILLADWDKGVTECAQAAAWSAFLPRPPQSTAHSHWR